MPDLKISPGASIHYEDDNFTDPWTKPETVLFIHGNSESGGAWFAWIPYFCRHFRLLRPDTRGFAQSSPTPKSYEWNVQDLTDDVARVADHAGVKRFHLVAAKSGGPVAVHFAATRPERVKTLALLGSPVSGGAVRAQNRGGGIGEVPPANDAEWTQRQIAWARRTMPGRLGSKMPPEALEYWSQQMGNVPPSSQQGFLRLLPTIEVASDLPHIACPTLVVVGSGAEVTDGVENVRSWQRLIPHSDLMVVPNDGFHVAVGEADLVAPATLEFIQRHSTGGK